MKIPCGHIYCETCIRSALAHSDTCPLCTRKLFVPRNTAARTIVVLERTLHAHKTAFTWLIIGVAIWISAHLPLVSVDIYFRHHSMESTIAMEVWAKAATTASSIALHNSLGNWTMDKGSRFKQLIMLMASILLINGIALCGYADWEG